MNYCISALIETAENKQKVTSLFYTLVFRRWYEYCGKLIDWTNWLSIPMHWIINSQRKHKTDIVDKQQVIEQTIVTHSDENFQWELMSAPVQFGSLSLYSACPEWKTCSNFLEIEPYQPVFFFFQLWLVEISVNNGILFMTDKAACTFLKGHLQTYKTGSVNN